MVSPAPTRIEVTNYLYWIFSFVTDHEMCSMPDPMRQHHHQQYHRMGVTFISQQFISQLFQLPYFPKICFCIDEYFRTIYFEVTVFLYTSVLVDPTCRFVKPLPPVEFFIAKHSAKSYWKSKKLFEIPK